MILLCQIFFSRVDPLQPKFSHFFPFKITRHEANLSCPYGLLGHLNIHGSVTFEAIVDRIMYK